MSARICWASKNRMPFGRAFLIGPGGGTLYIPDVQELPAEVITLLNQVLESGHYSREQGSDSLPLECRVIAAGCVDLMVRVQKDPGLEQLYYRLNVLPLQVASLRERQDDVPDLVRFYSDWFPIHENLPYRSFSVSAQNRLAQSQLARQYP